MASLTGRGTEVKEMVCLIQVNAWRVFFAVFVNYIYGYKDDKRTSAEKVPPENVWWMVSPENCKAMPLTVNPPIDWVGKFSYFIKSKEVPVSTNKWSLVTSAKNAT